MHFLTWNWKYFDDVCWLLEVLSITVEERIDNRWFLQADKKPEFPWRNDDLPLICSSNWKSHSILYLDHWLVHYLFDFHLLQGDVFPKEEGLACILEAIRDFITLGFWEFVCQLCCLWNFGKWNLLECLKLWNYRGHTWIKKLIKI